MRNQLCHTTRKYACVLRPVRCSVFTLHPVACTTFANVCTQSVPQKKSTDWQRHLQSDFWHFRKSVLIRSPSMQSLSFLPLMSFSPLLGFFPLLRIPHRRSRRRLCSTDVTPLLAFFSELRAQLQINGSLSVWSVGVSLSFLVSQCKCIWMKREMSEGNHVRSEHLVLFSSSLYLSKIASSILPHYLPD